MSRSAHEASTQQQREYKRVEVLRDAVQMAMNRLEYNARNAFGAHPYDARPIAEFGPVWQQEDPKDYETWQTLRSVLIATETI